MKRELLLKSYLVDQSPDFEFECGGCISDGWDGSLLFRVVYVATEAFRAHPKNVTEKKLTTITSRRISDWNLETN